MITNEDIKVIISLKVRCNKEVRKYLNDYTTEQEKKNRLLELYRKAHPEISVFNPYFEQIKALEEEMK